MAKDPVLPLYYNDLISSTQDWTDEEFGAYVRLLIYQWDKGALPESISRMVRVADSAQKNWSILSKKFSPTETGLKNERMEEIRNERSKFKEKQKRNIETRYQKSTKSLPNEEKKDTKILPLEEEIENEEEEEIESEEVPNPSNSIIGQMAKIYCEHVTEYSYDWELDNMPLGEILRAIKKQECPNKDPVYDEEARMRIFNCWQQMSSAIAKDTKFYRNKGLKSIASNISTIFQMTKNESTTSKTGASNSRGNAESFYNAASGFNRKGE